MFHRARRKLNEMTGGSAIENTVVVGDTMETDIRGAIESGLQAYLVLSGSTQLESVCHYVYQPTRVLGSVADLVEELETGKPSSRLDSPMYSHGLPTPNWHGIRHQSEGAHLEKPRPSQAAGKTGKAG